MERDFKGVWIPKEIWLNTQLSLIEKCLLTEINSLDNEKHCWASNSYFAQFFNTSERTISRAVSKLQKLGYIEIENKDGRHRVTKCLVSLDKMST